MAISLIGQAGVSGGDQASPQVITYSSSNGNALILVGFLYYNNAQVPGISSIVDNANNTWHYATGSSQNPPYGYDAFNGESIQFVAWSLNAAPITSMTLTMPTISPWTRMTLSEWSGIAALDDCASAVSDTGTNAGVALNLSAADDLVVGAFENNFGTSFSLPTGWSQFASSGANNVAYGFPGVSGPYTPAFTLSQSSDWGVAIAAFRATSPYGAMLSMFP